ncbi:thiamine pyrophosphate-binding protein [Natronomonas salina]|uniref:thiamine pyrophosphate-binding protein n=1 Tax=Natronomonas salina TaxID=1710540 RepID=UPI0015B717A7|nr:thiamine pyrophosphate-binding protein [Natronomonas salina]QLD90804.1 thiamine pyrophosphate-binding protein [Natronomonas salina]
MTVGDEVVAALAEAGIDTVFGIPGKQTLPLNEAMADHGVRYVVARHETAVSHQAWGYAETSGRPAATVVIPGPGDMNAMNGLKNARNDCTPLVHVAVETEPDVRGGDGIHETPPDTYDNVVKENVTVERPQAAAAEVTQAFRTATTDPKGPVRVGIPKDFLGMTVPLAVPSADGPTESSKPGPSGVAEAVETLEASDLPVVIAGGGVRASGATDELVAVAERLDAPVVTTYKGKGTIPEDHSLSAGVLCGGTSPDLAALVAESDAALTVGTDFDAVWTGQWRFDLPADLIHVTLDPEDVGTGYEPSTAIVADAGRTLAELAEQLPPSDATGETESDDRNGADRATGVREADAARIDDLRDDDEPPLTSPSALAAVRAALPRDVTVAADAGGFRIWTLVSFPAYGPRSYVNPGSWATMGTGLPSAIGAKLANPDDDVLALTGDGGLLMCIHELHTLAAEGLDVVVVVFSNQDYAIISEEAERSYGLAPMAYGWDDAAIDFTAIAEGMGVRATRAETLSGIETAVADALAHDDPALIEVPTDPEEPQASEWMRDGTS